MTGRVSVPGDAEPSPEDRPVPPMKRAADALIEWRAAWDESTRKIHERRVRGEEPS